MLEQAPSRGSRRRGVEKTGHPGSPTLSSAVVGLLLIAAVSPSPAAARSASAPLSAPVVFPLKLSENKRYLVDQKGVPFLIIADSPQGLIGRLTEKQAESYFADREKHGFNTLGWMDVACAGPDYPQNLYATTPEGIRPFSAFLPGGSDYTYYDLSKPNEAYFVRLDHLLNLATAHHLAVFLDPIETIGWLPTLRRNGLEAAYRYGQFLGRRYKGYANLMWISGNDFKTWPAGQDGALIAAAKEGIRPFVEAWRTRNDDALVQAVAKGIRSEAPEQLQTIELEPQTSSSFDDPAWRSMADLNSTYSYSPTFIQMLHSYNQSPVAPTYLAEGHYEFENIGDPADMGTAAVLRKQAYWTLLSGGAGQFYGNKYSWSFKDGWQENIDTAGVEQIGYWREFFLSLPWQDLIPDQNRAILSAGAGSTCDLKTHVSQCDYALAAMSADRSVVVIYLPTVRAISVNIAALNGAARATWFDPSNGEVHEVSSRTFRNSGTEEFTPPGHNHSGDGDWVLLLRAVGKVRAAPSRRTSK